MAHFPLLSCENSTVEEDFLSRPTTLFFMFLVLLMAQAVTALELDRTRFMGIEEVRPGMTGYGLSVFKCYAVERFDVRVVDVIYSFIGPRSHAVLAEISGGPDGIVDQARVISGMSGSPIYLTDNQGRERLVGALAYGWGMGVIGLVGITPIAEMLAVGEQADEVAETWHEQTAAPGRLFPREMLTRPDELATLFQPHDASAETSPGLETPGGFLPRLSIPLVLSGLSPQTVRLARPLLERMGLTPVTGGGGGGTGDLYTYHGPAPAYTPGGAIGAILFNGDAVGAGVGTITHVEGDRVLAFGHPMFNFGAFHAPVAPAVIHGIVPLLTSSFKVGTALDPNGVLLQDRPAAIAARQGPPPRMVPLNISVDFPGQRHEKPYRFNLTPHQEFMPLFTAILFLNTVLSGLAEGKDVTVQVDFRAQIEGRDDLVRHEVFSGGSPVSMALALMAPLLRLTLNEYQPVVIESLDMQITSREERSALYLEEVILLDRRVRAEQEVRVMLKLQDYRGRRLQREVRVPLPASLPSGAEYAIEIMDDASFRKMEQKRAPAKGYARSLEHLIRLVNTEASAHQFHLLLTSGETGVVLNGEEHARLLPTFLSKLVSSRAAGMHGLTKGTVLGEELIDFPAPVYGMGRVSFVVD
jgi:hypothetical protein